MAMIWNWIAAAFDSWWAAHKLELVAPLVLFPFILVGGLIYIWCQKPTRRRGR